MDYFPFSFSYAKELGSEWKGLMHLTIPGSCFHFTNYYHAVQIVKRYSKATFYDQYSKEINNGLDDILDVIAPLFLKMYKTGLATEIIPEFEQECEFIEMVTGSLQVINNSSFADSYLQKGNWSIFNKDFSWDFYSPKFLNQDEITPYLEMDSLVTNQGKIKESPTWILPEVFFQRGVFFNDHLLYLDAIEAFSQAIFLDPKNREYFIERASAYFETNQIELASKDYESAKQLSLLTKKNYFLPPINTLHKSVSLFAPSLGSLEFASGLVKGTLKGGQHSALEFVPSTLTCCRGILFGLWSVACSPEEVGQDFISAAYAFGDFLSEVSCEECVGIFVPEVIDLKRDWDQLNDHDKGYRFGWIIGKYGLDVFIPLGSVKALAKFRALKQANTILTLEACASSQSGKIKILEQAAIRNSQYKKAVEVVKQAKIAVKDANTAYHIMQPRHAWGKVIKLSGDVKEDLKKVLKLLEENDILNSKNLLKPPTKFEQTSLKIIRSDYEISLGALKIRAVSISYVESGEIFLKDAWVVSPK